MYEEILKFVKDKLENIDDNPYLPFRKRSEHIIRVFMWVQRLADGEPGINKEAVLISALFHDIGYALDSDNSVHAENSAILCEKYLLEKEYNIEFINFVKYLVRNHSDKKQMAVNGIPPELIILMEADLLDEGIYRSVII